MDEFKEIMASDATDIDKMAQMFGHVTGKIVEYSQMEIDMAKAMNNQEGLVKQQIKLSTIEHARSIFAMCYQQVTGEKLWDE